MSRLTVQRLFSDPPLVSALPGQVRFSPTGRYVTYTLIAEDNREFLDLWLYDCESGEQRKLIDENVLGALDGELSLEEKQRLERLRQFAGGVTGYAWFPDEQSLLLPLKGTAYQFDLASGVITELAPQIGAKGEARLSPKGTYLTFVSNGDLYVHHLANATTERVTTDATEDVSNGVADFIAQEEMHRFAGYWWSSDDRELVFTRVDASTIPMTERQEIHADGAHTVRQRYPFVGGPNAAVELLSFDVQSQQVSELAPPLGNEDYLARVGFAGPTLTVQIQDRAQQALKLWARDGANWTMWHEETSDTWVNLHDNLTAVGTHTMLWTSEATGQARLMAGAPGALQYATPPTMHVNEVCGCDGQLAWVVGWDDTPTEQHLYEVRLDGSGVRRLTEPAGWHVCQVHVETQHFLSAHSASTSPPSLSLMALGDGHVVSTLHRTEIGESHPYSEFAATHQSPTFGTVTAEDGAVMHYRLTPPVPQQPAPEHGYPVIVYVYGGPGAQKVKNEWAPLLLQLFAHAGFGVFELDNRGSTNRGRHFEAPIYQRLGEPEVADQLAGVAALQTIEWVDPARIGVFGHSYGGYMTLMCLSKASHVFKAGVAAAPVSDWQLYDTHYTERYLGHPESSPEAYRSSAVLPWLEGLERPLLLLHGMADDNVLFTHSTLLMRELQRLNKRFELMTYPGSRHALQERDVSIHRFELILDFFRRHL